MEYQATGKYIRTSNRKLLPIAREIKKLSPASALMHLSALPKRAADPLREVLASAVANAKNKQVKVEDLQIKHIDILKGPAMKRWRAVSRGQAHAYKKHMAHIHVVLTEKNKN